MPALSGSGKGKKVKGRRNSRMRMVSRAESKSLTEKFDALCGEVTTKKVSAEEMEKLFS